MNNPNPPAPVLSPNAAELNRLNNLPVDHPEHVSVWGCDGGSLACGLEAYIRVAGFDDRQTLWGFGETTELAAADLLAGIAIVRRWANAHFAGRLAVLLKADRDFLQRLFQQPIAMLTRPVVEGER